MIRLSLAQKIVLLVKIYLIKFRIIKMVWFARAIPLSDEGIKGLNLVKWERVAGYRYKKIPDTTGEYRFFIPELADNVVWRINPKYSFTGRDRLPELLKVVITKDGYRNNDIYRMVFDEGKTFINGEYK